MIKHASSRSLLTTLLQKTASESNFGHVAELAGLGILAAPSIQHLRKKPMSERKSHLVNAAGLAVLAAPSLLELAKHKKTAAQCMCEHMINKRQSTKKKAKAAQP